MLRFLAFPALAVAAAPRALADGASGTLGSDVVGAHEVRDASLPLDKLAPLSGGMLVGRLEGVGGPPTALSAADASAMLARTSQEIVAPSRDMAMAMSLHPTTRILNLLGYDFPGDRGMGRYLRASSEPSHPGKFQTADGAWWELSETVVTLQHFGGVASTPEAPVFADDALDAAMDYCHKTGASLQVEGMFVLNELHEYAHGIHMFGRIEIRLSNELPTKYVAGFYCNVGAGIHLASAGTVGFGLVERLSFIDSANTPLPPNRQSYDKVPMLGFGRGSSWQWRSLRFRGMDRRWCNFRAGMIGAAWNHIFEKIDTHGAQIGAWIGGESDNTDNVIIGCTFHHCHTVGVIIQNPSGGSMSGSSSEWNDGPVGVYLMSYDPEEAHRARNFKISENYIFRPSGNVEAVDLDGSCGVQVGGTLVWSDFTEDNEGGEPEDEITSNMTPESIVIDNNYLVAQRSRHAVRIDSGRRGCRVTNNLVMSESDTDAGDFLINAPGTFVYLNTNQNKGWIDRLSEASTAAAVSYLIGSEGGATRIPSALITLKPDAAIEFQSYSDGLTSRITQRGMTMGVGTDGSSAFREHAAVRFKEFKEMPAGVSVVLTPDDIPGSVNGVIRAVFAIERTNGSGQVAIELTYAMLNGAPHLTVHTRIGAPSSAVTLSSDTVQFDFDGTWQGVAILTAAGMPYSS